MNHTEASVQKILIVDDHVFMAKILEEILKKEKYICYCAENTNEARENISKAKPDLILLDIMMPDEDGFQFCQKLKSDNSTSDIPVIFISAKIETEDKLHGFKIGAVDYITKPFNHSEVIARVNTHIQLKKSKDIIEKYNEKLEELVEIRTKDLIKSEKQAIFGQMIQGIIHNIRGPVANVISSISLLKFYEEDMEVVLKNIEKDKDINDLREKLKEVWETVDYEEKMLERLLKTIDLMMLKSKSDRVEINEICDLNKLIEQEVEFLKADRSFNKIEKEIILCKQPLKINVIPAEISQIFTNIVRNAIDAMQGRINSKIEISTGVKKENVWFSIKDNGIGIDAGVLEKIFEPFFSTKTLKNDDNDRNKNSNLSIPGGIGIGLHYCKQTIESYNGHINVNTKPGEGSEFVVSLPMIG